MKLKNLLKVLLCIIVLLSIPVFTYAQSSIPEHTQDFYVNDFANVFSKDEISEMVNRANSLDENHNGIQVVVSTVESLNGESIDDYSIRMYNQYGIGKDDMGVLILLATQDRDIKVAIRKCYGRIYYRRSSW